MRLPPEGSRLIVASDGVWDAFEKTSKVPAMSRGWSVSVRCLRWYWVRNRRPVSEAA